MRKVCVAKGQLCVCPKVTNLFHDSVDHPCDVNLVLCGEAWRKVYPLFAKNLSPIPFLCAKDQVFGTQLLSVTKKTMWTVLEFQLVVLRTQKVYEIINGVLFSEFLTPKWTLF